MLENGSTVAADIVIAADGTNSGIRQIMFPGAERKLTDQYVFQANIPREAMYEEEFTKPFYEDPATRVYLGPNSWSFASVAAHQSIYDMQLVLRDFALSRRDPHPERLLEPLENLDMIGDSIDAWDPQYKSILAKATTFFKWRVAEAPHLPTALAKGGKVVLIGDAYHGIDPSAGFGTALSLEDGFTLALLLSKAPSLAEVPTYLSIYDKIQRERSGAVGKYSTFMGMFLGLPDGQVQTMRDKAMRKFDPNSTLDAKASIRAKYGTPEWQAYMDDYEPEKAVEDALREHAKETALEPGSVTSRM